MSTGRGVVADGDVRALIDTPEVGAIALEFGMAREVVAREMSAARDGFARFTRRRVTGILDRGDFGMAFAQKDVEEETRRRLRALEFTTEYGDAASVTWLDQLAPSARTRTYTLSSRLDLDLRAPQEGAGNGAP